VGELTENKRYAVAAAVLFHQRATAFDGGAQMLIRQMGKIERSADEALKGGTGSVCRDREPKKQA
jgi:hypothetical protein